MERVKLQDKYQLFIGGQWKDASDGKTFVTTCPANGEKLAECAQATREDVDAAVQAAWKAFATWKNTTVTERSAILNQIADIIDANKEHLAMVETMDNGKPIRETMAVDIPLAAQHFRYFAGCIMAEEGSAKMLDENETLSLILREPIGVVGQIVPWNFPFLMAAWKLAPVLASGCCTVFKPSSSTPLSVLELAPPGAGCDPRRRVQRDHRLRLQIRAVHAGAQGLPQAGLHRLHGGGPERGRRPRRRS